MIDHEEVKANHDRNRRLAKFNLARLKAACRYNGLVNGDGDVCARRVHARLTQYMMGEKCNPAELRSVQRVLNGDTDPTRGSAGRRALIFYLAPALGFTVDWLTSSSKRRRRS